MFLLNNSRRHQSRTGHTLRAHYVEMTSMRRQDVTSTSLRRHFDVMCLLGEYNYNKFSKTGKPFCILPLDWFISNVSKEKPTAHSLKKGLHISIYRFINKHNCSILVYYCLKVEWSNICNNREIQYKSFQKNKNNKLKK